MQTADAHPPMRLNSPRSTFHAPPHTGTVVTTTVYAVALTTTSQQKSEWSRGPWGEGGDKKMRPHVVSAEHTRAVSAVVRENEETAVTISINRSTGLPSAYRETHALTYLQTGKYYNTIDHNLLTNLKRIRVSSSDKIVTVQRWPISTILQSIAFY